ncbi:MAG: VanZ family protein [Flavobacteriales bacterium]|nr:VanZ family protein [Flavobacteriales bacterium]
MRILNLVPAAAWTAVILFLLLSESSGLPKFWWLDFPFSDKVVHAVIFAVGSILLVHGLRSLQWKMTVLAVACWALVVGSATEYYQHCCLKTRTGEWPDLLADVAGALLPLIVRSIQKA